MKGLEKPMQWQDGETLKSTLKVSCGLLDHTKQTVYKQPLSLII